MRRILASALLTLLAFGALTPRAEAGKWTVGMKEGKPSFQSMGSLAFGPEGVLFVADTKAAAIIAIATEEPAAAPKPVKVEGLGTKVAGLLGVTADQIIVEDMAVSPGSGNVYLSVSRGRGPEAVPVLIRVKSDGMPEVIALDRVKYSRVELPNAPADMPPGEGRRSTPRMESITDIAFLEGKVLVAGLTNEEFASTLRAIPFPFKAADKGTGAEIYHGAHGRFETRAPVRTFVPFKIGNETHILAAYTCTPLVQFAVKELTPGAKIKGKTIAELGNRNRPLDMITYQKDGKTYLLLANSSRGVMKINTEAMEKAESITTPVEGTKGLAYETVSAWTGVDQLDRLDNQNVVVLRRAQDGALTLETMPLP